MDTIQIVYCTATIPHTEYITEIGSKTERWTKAQAIEARKAGTIFCTVGKFGKVALMEVIAIDGKEHIQSVPDGEKSNNLLELPPCPPSLPFAA